MIRPWDSLHDDGWRTPITDADLAWIGIPAGLYKACNVPDLRRHVHNLFDTFDDEGVKMLSPNHPAPAFVFHGTDADLSACRMLTGVFALHRVRQTERPWMLPGPDPDVPVRPGFCRAVDAQSLKGLWSPHGPLAGHVREGGSLVGCEAPVGSLALLSVPADTKARLFRAQDAVDCFRFRANAGLTTFMAIPGSPSTQDLTALKTAPHVRIIAA